VPYASTTTGAGTAENRTRHHESSGADRLAKEPDSQLLEPL